MPRPLRRVSVRATLATACAAAALCLSPVAASAPTDSASGRSSYTWFDPVIDVQRLIADRYVVDPDLSSMQEAAIEGIVEALNDPYTEYIGAEHLAEFNKQIRGEYVGIGAQVRMEDGWVTIVSPLENSPALQAGLQPGDRIVAIDGESTMGSGLQETIDRLSGQSGQSVTLTVERDAQRLDVLVTRRAIVTRTVAGFTRVGDGWDYMIDPDNRVAYIRISQFGADTVGELGRALDTVVKQGVRGIVLDLRFDPGGLLTAAVGVADYFLDEGLIVTARGRSAPDQTHYAKAEGTIADIPLAVLLNRRSASASEVVAGALVDHGRAIVVGTRSFGKGSVQDVMPLPSGAGQLKLTVQRYYGPSGRSIHREDDSTQWGIDPTPGFYVPMTDEEYNRLLRIRTDRDVIRGGSAADEPGARSSGTSIPGWIRETYADKQLAAAVEAVQLRLQTGEWKPTGKVAGESEVRLVEMQRMQEARQRLVRELERIERRVEALGDAGLTAEADERSILPDEAELTGGRVEVFDAAGKRLATLRITGDGLERWLVDAPVEKQEEE